LEHKHSVLSNQRWRAGNNNRGTLLNPWLTFRSRGTRRKRLIPHQNVRPHKMAHRYEHPTRYLVYSVSFAVGRTAFVLALITSILAVLGGSSGQNGVVPSAPLFWSSVVHGAFWVLGIGLATWLAFYLRCHVCRHPQVWWRMDVPAEYRSPYARSPLKRWFYSDELRDRRFVCPHCSTEFSFHRKERAD
jgi:hypothetical protein